MQFRLYRLLIFCRERIGKYVVDFLDHIVRTKCAACGADRLTRWYSLASYVSSNTRSTFSMFSSLWISFRAALPCCRPCRTDTSTSENSMVETYSETLISGDKTWELARAYQLLQVL